MGIRLACDPVAGVGGCEGALPNVEEEVPTLGRGQGGGREAESKSACRERNAHKQIVARNPRLGQCSGMTPERVVSRAVESS